MSLVVYFFGTQWFVVTLSVIGVGSQGCL